MTRAVDAYTQKIERIAREDERCQRLLKVEGIGPLGATAIMAAVGDARVFKNGREMAAWLGSAVTHPNFAHYKSGG